MIDQALHQRIAARIQACRDDMVRMQIELTSIPALAPENGGDGEEKKAAFLMERLRTLGFDHIEEHPAPDDRVPCGFRPNIAVHLRGKRSDGKVWIFTHLDVVPPGDRTAWETDPYQAFERNGRIYGRGTEDNQQDMVACIFAAKAFLDEGIQPERSIGLVFVADEEMGSKWGIEHLIRHGKIPFQKTDILVIPDFGNDEGSMIEVAEKSMLWVRFQTKGKQCHASKPSLGNNAFLAASHLVVRLQALHALFDAVDPVYDPPGSTFEPTKKETNVPNVNTIPGDDVFYLDCRVLPQYALDEVLDQMRGLAEEIERAFGVTVEISPIQKNQAPPPTPDDAPVVRALQAAVKDVYGVSASPVGIGGGTVAAFFRKEGFHAAVWSRIGQNAHQPNESCLIENMLGNAKVYSHLFLQV
ncbi:MAG: M20 family metallo-hydrolase [Deltaproteobacteria bacterium]|nr:M20 family metallo-hydrolase [Deltaproteobacteria bacterium]